MRPKQLAHKALAGILATVIATPVAADAQLGDLITLFPLIFLAGLYVAAVESFIWLWLAAAVFWAWFWAFDSDIENMALIAFLSEREGGPSLKWATTLLASLAVIVVIVGSVLIDPEVKQRIWSSESKPASSVSQSNRAGLETPEPAKPPANHYRNPMGGAWPTQSGLIGGRFAAAPSSGTLEIDNRAGQSGIYLKLCDSSTARCPGIRHFFVAHGDRFSAAGLASGYFHVRYVETKSPDTVRWAKSASFEIRSGATAALLIPPRPGVKLSSNISVTQIEREDFR